LAQMSTKDQALSNEQPSVNKTWLLLVIGLGSFTASVNTSVVNIALPSIQRTLAPEVTQVDWVATIYLLVVSGALLSFGRLGDLRGHRPIYLSGIVAFVIGSILCGFAPSLEVLLVFRAIQALGGAMVLANETAILTHAFEAERRGRTLGLQSALTYLGLAVGPWLGGLIVDHLGWRWVFFVNVPLGLLMLGLSFVFVPRDARSGQNSAFDLAGALVFMAGLAALLLALNKGRAWGWSSPAVLGLAGAAVALGAVFVLIEARSPQAMLDLSLFRRPNFAATTLSSILNNACVSDIIFLIPFILIQGRGLLAAEAGLLLAIRPAVMVCVAPFSGILSDRLGPRPLRLAGMATLAASSLWLGWAMLQPAIWPLVLGLACLGLGGGLFISANNSALMGAAPQQRQGIAGGMLAVSRNMGMALGVGLGGASFVTPVLTSQASAKLLFGLAAQPGLLAATASALLGAALILLRERRAEQTTVREPVA
jgi:EmrB/QacA subfamily drug resistance transporter